MKKKLTDYPELMKQWHPTKNGNLNPTDLNDGSIKRVWWKCPIADDHEWETIVYRRTLESSNCPCCRGLKVVSSNCLANLRPELVKEWHPTKNGDLTPYKFTVGSGKKVWWKCPIADDHEWMSNICNRSREKSTGCPFCVNQKVDKNYNSFAITHPHFIKYWHPIKNGALTPFDVVFGSGKKVWWIIEESEYESTINNFIKNKIDCHFREKICKQRNVCVTHPELIKQWHPTKNENLNPCDFLAGSSKRVWWKCPIADDHEWESTIKNRAINSNNCPCCRGLKVVSSNCLATLNPSVAAEWHPLKNNKLTPFNFTIGSDQSINWICEKNHEWKAKISGRCKRINGSNCPICNESQGEKAIREYLLSNKIAYKFQYQFKNSSIEKSKFDFAISSGLIEYQGEQHYVPINFGSKKENAKYRTLFLAIKNDLKKEYWCNKHNIPLLKIPYWEFLNIPDILNNFIFENKIIDFLNPPKEVLDFENVRQEIIKKINFRQS